MSSAKADGIVVICGDFRDLIPFLVLVSRGMRDRLDVLTTAGGSLPFSFFDGNVIISTRKLEWLNVKNRACLIDLGKYLMHGAETMHLADHSGCGFRKPSENPIEEEADCRKSLDIAAQDIIEFVQALTDENQDLAQELEVDSSLIKLKKINTYYIELNKDEQESVKEIKQTGEFFVRNV